MESRPQPDPKQSGIGASPLSLSPSHILADHSVYSHSDQSDRDSVDNTTVVVSCRSDNDPLTSDREASERGSSLLEESLDADIGSVATPSPMEVTEYTPVTSPRPSALPFDPLPPARATMYRPCSPPRWRTSRRRAYRPRSFNTGHAYAARQPTRRSPPAPSDPPSSSRGSRRGISRRQPFSRGRPARRETKSPPRDEWSAWRQNLPETTPAGFTHHLADRHPWGPLVRPRPPKYANIKNECTTSELPLDRYRPIPPGAYHATRWVRSLFPIYIRGDPTPSNKIPVMELQTLEAAITFWESSLEILNKTLKGEYQELVRTNEQTPLESYSSTAAPPIINETRPVLYQVVATGYGAGVILEAKDFFVIGPDRRDLHCIVLEQYAVDVLTEKRGFDQTLISVKDLVWVYSVTPTRAALQDPTNTLAASRIPRATALEASSKYFFRVDRFALINPNVNPHPSVGIVVSLIWHNGAIKKFLAVFEGAPEAMTITPSLCARDLEDVYQYSLVLAQTRVNCSCAIRFSEPPVSEEARDMLCQLVRCFLPVNTSEAVSPMRVMKLTQEDKTWLTDRVNEFTSYRTNTHSSKRRMGQLFNVACSTLAALATMHDDTTVRWVTLNRPPGNMCPVRFDFVLNDMAHEAGWARGRMVDFWVAGADHTTQMRVDNALFDTDSKRLSVRIMGFTWNHASITALLSTHGRRQDDHHVIDGYVRLGKLAKAANAANEAVSRFLHIVERIPSGTTGHRILDTVYRKSTSDPPTPSTRAHHQATPSNLPDTFRTNQQTITLTTDQQAALWRVTPFRASTPLSAPEKPS
ncbi:hypothetical protein V3C99_015755 [Haemonchus contortus]